MQADGESRRSSSDAPTRQSEAWTRGEVHRAASRRFEESVKRLSATSMDFLEEKVELIKGRNKKDDGMEIVERLLRLKGELKHKARTTMFFRELEVDPKAQQVERTADIIKAYRGIIEEEEDYSARPWVDKAPFEITMACLSVANLLMYGFEIDYIDQTDHDFNKELWAPFMAGEAFFCIVFSAEIVLKVRCHTWRWLTSKVWNFILPVVCLGLWIDFSLHLCEYNASLQTLGLLRLISLLRLMKIFSFFNVLNELRLVMGSVAHSVNTLVWVVVLLFLFLFVCAVFLTEAVGKDEALVMYTKQSGGWDYEEHFGSIVRSMFTLLQVMTLDNWSNGVARHLINYSWEWSLFFIFFVGLSSMGLLQIVVAVIVEHVLLAAQTNHRRNQARGERLRKQELESIKEVFSLTDQNHSGLVSLADFLEAAKNPEVLWRMRNVGLPMSAAAQLFAVIDGDGSRQLTINEFINGCRKLKGDAQSKDLLAIQAQADKLSLRMDRLARSLSDSEKMVKILDEVTLRAFLRFGSAVESSRRRVARQAGGLKPVVQSRRGNATVEVPLQLGNAPKLPDLPDLLR